MAEFTLLLICVVHSNQSWCANKENILAALLSPSDIQIAPLGRSRSLASQLGQIIALRDRQFGLLLCNLNYNLEPGINNDRIRLFKQDSNHNSIKKVFLASTEGRGNAEVFNYEAPSSLRDTAVETAVEATRKVPIMEGVITVVRYWDLEVIYHHLGNEKWFSDMAFAHA